MKSHYHWRIDAMGVNIELEALDEQAALEQANKIIDRKSYKITGVRECFGQDGMQIQQELIENQREAIQLQRQFMLEHKESHEDT